MLRVKSMIVTERDSYSAQAVIPLHHKRCSQAVMTVETFMITSVACSATERDIIIISTQRQPSHC